jgi:hypothetical protein
MKLAEFSSKEMFGCQESRNKQDKTLWPNYIKESDILKVFVTVTIDGQLAMNLLYFEIWLYSFFKSFSLQFFKHHVSQKR